MKTGHIAQIKDQIIDLGTTITTTSLPPTMWLDINGNRNEIGENEMKESENKWRFNALHESLIEFDDIASELSGKNPIAVVTHGDTEKYVVLSEWLLVKMQVLSIDCLAVEKHIEGDGFIVYKIEDNFKEWINWAKKIKAMPWPENRRKHDTVMVSLPKI